MILPLLALGLSIAAPPSRAAVERRIRKVTIRYLDVSGTEREGMLEIDSSLSGEVVEIFEEIRRAGFPLRGVRPMSDFGGDDEAAMRADNTSGFNWREARGLGRLSWHALGRAIDVNPLENPWVRGDRIRPKGARHDVSVPGTLRDGDPVVRAFLRHGWHWGGRWRRVKDFQHFEKPLPGVDLEKR